jgi:hypothetical protein
MIQLMLAVQSRVLMQLMRMIIPCPVFSPAQELPPMECLELPVVVFSPSAIRVADAATNDGVPFVGSWRCVGRDALGIRSLKEFAMRVP